MKTSNSNDDQIEEVYDKIEETIETIKGEENLIILENWKTQ